MPLICESKNFLVESMDKPLVGRGDGGHIVINPKVKVATLQALSPAQAIELMRLLMVTGEAMTTVLRNNGIDIGRINYQDNGNWGVFLPEGPYQHFHLYGRAKNAVVQPYGQSLSFPHKNECPEFYATLDPLTEQDVTGIRNEIERLLALEKFHDSNWFPKNNVT